MTTPHFLSPLLNEYVARMTPTTDSDLSFELDAIHVSLWLRLTEITNPGTFAYAFSHGEN